MQEHMVKLNTFLQLSPYRRHFSQLLGCTKALFITPIEVTAAYIEPIAFKTSCSFLLSLLISNGNKNLSWISFSCFSYKCLINEYRLPKSTQFAFTNIELLFFPDRTVQRRNYTINVTHKSQLMTITRQNQTSKSEYL